MVYQRASIGDPGEGADRMHPSMRRTPSPIVFFEQMLQTANRRRAETVADQMHGAILTPVCDERTAGMGGVGACIVVDVVSTRRGVGGKASIQGMDYRTPLSWLCLCSAVFPRQITEDLDGPPLCSDVSPGLTRRVFCRIVVFKSLKYEICFSYVPLSFRGGLPLACAVPLCSRRNL